MVYAHALNRGGARREGSSRSVIVMFTRVGFAMIQVGAPESWRNSDETDTCTRGRLAVIHGAPQVNTGAGRAQPSCYHPRPQ